MGPKTANETGGEWSKMFDVGGLMEMQRKAFEGMLEGWGKAASGYQRLATRQMEMMRETMDEMNAALTDLGGTGGKSGKPGEAQLELARRALERASANMKELMGLAASANAEAMQSMQAQLAALFTAKDGGKKG
jgi:phasin family protein